jgi:glycosyltransferase involved in cell wall biosynthesis
VSDKIPIDIIIRTTAEKRRHKQLNRAIESIKTQEGVKAIPIVVVNGDRYDEMLLKELKNRQDIRFSYIEKGSAGNAMRVGRQLVTSDYFGFLDDDDEYLERALITRLNPMLQDSSIDLVVTNGFVEIGGDKKIQIPNITQHQDNELEGIISRCWLASCGGLFKSSSIQKEYFDGTTDHQELTLLAFKLAVFKKKIHFMDNQTYIVHDTPSSASKSFTHLETSIDVLKKMRTYDIPRNARNKLELKYRNTLHVLAVQCIRQGLYKLAWIYHIKSLKPPYTLRYFPFTRKLIFPFVIKQ